MNPPIYRVRFLPVALELLEEIRDTRVRQTLMDRAMQLAEEPEKQGKQMLGDMARFRCARAVGQRYRIIYEIVRDEVIVFVVALGIRKEGSKNDIYNLAKRLLRLGLLEPPEPEQKEDA